MQKILCHLAVFSSVWLGSFVYSAAVLNQPSVPTNTIQPQHVTNSTLLASLSPWFETIIEEEARGPEISVTLCLEAAVTLIGKNLALESFTEQIQPQGWSYQNVVFAVSTKGVLGNNIERRFVIWGIFEALLQMKNREDTFRSAIFTLKMYGNVKGYLSIYPKDLVTIDHPSSSVALTQLDPPISYARNDTIRTVPSNLRNFGASGLRLVIFDLQPRRLISLYGMYINVIASIVDAAEKPKNEAIRGRIYTEVPQTGIRVAITGGAVLNYKWAIKAVALIPESLVVMGQLSLFGADIFANTIHIGTILMERSRDSFTGAGSNVSTGSVTAMKQ